MIKVTYLKDGKEYTATIPVIKNSVPETTLDFKKSHEGIHIIKVERAVGNMKKYRVQIFKGDKSENFYFYDRDEAIIYGTKQLSNQYVTAVFLLKHVIDGKYDVEMEIK